MNGLFPSESILLVVVPLDRPHDEQGDSAPMNKVTLLQILQCLREHLLGTVRHQPTDFIEAQYARHSRPLVAYPLPFASVKHIEHQHRPLVTETTHYLPDRTG